MDTETKKAINRLERRLDKLALEQLREVVVTLSTQVERLEMEASRAHEAVDFWHEQATEMQLALCDENYATHHCVGINKEGEMMVVKIDDQPN